jgi:hypothetical protein
MEASAPTPEPPGPSLTTTPSRAETKRFGWPLFVAFLAGPPPLDLLSTMGKMEGLAITPPLLGGMR